MDEDRIRLRRRYLELRGYSSSYIEDVLTAAGGKVSWHSFISEYRWYPLTSNHVEGEKTEDVWHVLQSVQQEAVSSGDIQNIPTAVRPTYDNLRLQLAKYELFSIEVEDAFFNMQRQLRRLQAENEDDGSFGPHRAFRD